MTFHELEMKFGMAAAYQYLVEIEKTVNVPSAEMATIDPEVRLSYALRLQNDNEAANG